MGKRQATAAEVRAMANPLRLRILRVCLDQALTNKQIADAVGRDPGTILHHVRQLVSTGFLVAEDVRQGDSGALEKPYRATGKSWILDVDEPDAKASVILASLDAFREELAARPESVVESARMGLRLSPTELAELQARLEAVVHDFEHCLAAEGEPFGLYFVLHRRE